MRVLIVGAAVAGIAAAEALRGEGFDGEITLIGDELGMPYDRPPLSKQFLLGEREPTDLALRPPGFLEDLGIEHLGGRAAVALDPQGTLYVEGAARHTFDGLIVATGSSPRRLPRQPSSERVRVLRTLQDAVALRHHLLDARRVAVVGAGFIGLEVASCAHALGKDVVVLEAAAQPMGGLFTPAVGRLFSALHKAQDVEIRCGISVDTLLVDDELVEGVLASGELIAADLIVVGVGAVPNTGWLEQSGLSLADGVLCGEDLRVAPRIYAAGDVARWQHPLFGRIRVEHWTTAGDHGRTAAANLAAELRGDSPPEIADEVPYFWSDQHRVKIQMAGWPAGSDHVEASVDGNRILVLFGRDNTLVAALTWNWPRALALQRRQLATAQPFDEAVAAAPGTPAEIDVSLVEVLGENPAPSARCRRA
jgi:NADPH-dependent 2,4-dienoyl-CoA reductase/sulfur reductase-like enzyme